MSTYFAGGTNRIYGWSTCGGRWGEKSNLTIAHGPAHYRIGNKRAWAGDIDKVETMRKPVHEKFVLHSDGDGEPLKG